MAGKNKPGQFGCISLSLKTNSCTTNNSSVISAPVISYRNEFYMCERRFSVSPSPKCTMDYMCRTLVFGEYYITLSAIANKTKKPTFQKINKVELGKLDSPHSGYSEIMVIDNYQKRYSFPIIISMQPKVVMNNWIFAYPNILHKSYPLYYA